LAHLTFRLARKAGSPHLHSKFGHRKLDAILNFFHKWGTSALAVSTAVPIPMPTSMLFAAAGASDYGVGRFLTVVIICRSVRYTFIAIVADHYGRHFVRVLRHPSQYLGLATAVRGGHLQLDHGWNSAQSKTDGCKHWVKLAAVRSSPQVQIL
jgi:membrane protein DedA with SNARE-associated domain